MSAGGGGGRGGGEGEEDICRKIGREEWEGTEKEGEEEQGRGGAKQGRGKRGEGWDIGCRGGMAGHGGGWVREFVGFWVDEVKGLA